MSCLRIMIDKKYSSTVFVSDYTEYNRHNTHAQSEHSGVHISEEPSNLIGSFELRNPRDLAFRAINFEENPAVLIDDKKKTLSQCECMFEALRHDHGKKHWVMLLELKYCLEKNVYTHVRAALGQIQNTYVHLRDVLKIIVQDEVNLFWVISTPEVENALDSIDGAFFDQDELLEIKESYKANLFYSNVVEIQTSRHLRQLV